MTEFERVLNFQFRSYIQPKIFVISSIFIALGIYSAFETVWVAGVLFTGAISIVGYSYYMIYTFNKILKEAHTYYKTSEISAKQYLLQQKSILEYHAKEAEHDINKKITSTDRRSSAYSTVKRVRYNQEVYDLLIEAIDRDIAQANSLN